MNEDDAGVEPVESQPPPQQSECKCQCENEGDCNSCVTPEDEKIDPIDARKIERLLRGFNRIPSRQNIPLAEVVHPKFRKEDGNKLGRNSQCPCGSDKKVKKCCTELL